MRRTKWTGLVAAAAVLAVGLAACDGQQQQPAQEEPAAQPPAAQPGAETGAAPGAVPPADLPEGVTPEMVAAGQQIFTGPGLCYTCHGTDGTGTQLGPNLTDDEWLNIDGSYEQIVQNITTGVPQPQQFPAPMPPKGGSSITDEQVREVAAYVYTLSHGS